MFEASFKSSALLKKVLEAIKDLLDEAIFECTYSGIQVQSMDRAHISLVSVILRSDGFEHFRCDRNLSMGMNLMNMAKIFKCANNDDALTMMAQDDPDKVTFMFESPTQPKILNFEMKLMHLDQEHLGIPETDYACIVRMPSSEFARICRNLSQFGDSMIISCNKADIKFTIKGDATANEKLMQTPVIDKEEKAVIIEMYEPVTQTFACSCLNSFAKASPLSTQVQLSMSHNVPLVVEYTLQDHGYVRFYLAPKIDD